MGAKPGRMKGNEQEAEYEEPGKRARETRPGRTGKTEEARAGAEHRGSHCEAEAGRSGKEETGGQVAGGGTEGDERNRKGSGKARKRKQKGSTRGTAVGSEARKGERKQTES